MLIRISAIILLLGIFSAGCIQRKPAQVAKKESPISAKLAAMIAEQDEASHDPAMTTERAIDLRKRHRFEVYALMAKALITEPQDLYRAALLMQATDSTAPAEISYQAHLLAAEAAAGGWQPAAFLAAANLDRYLILNGKLQVYGTQYYTDENGDHQMYPCDPSTTDSARASWNVPPLETLRQEIEALNADQP